MMQGRWKVACINWPHADAPHALSYFLDDDRGMIAEAFHSTWQDAMDRVNDVIERLSEQITS